MYYIKYQNFKINIEILSDDPLAMDSEISFLHISYVFFRSFINS